MAIKTKKAEAQKENAQAVADYKISITRVKVWENGNISFDAIVNDIAIYGMQYITFQKDGEEKSFVSFPSRKGADGKYYNYVYFKITDELFAEIEKQITDKINED